MNEIDSKTARFVGMVDGRRVYSDSSKRGLNHVQHVSRPKDAVFSGTIKEIERAMKSSFVRFRK